MRKCARRETNRPGRARWLAAFIVMAGMGAQGDDWPQWMGPRRDGVWRETGIVEVFPKEGLPVRWRVPVQRGYCGPAVADGRVFLVDRPPGGSNQTAQAEGSIHQNPGLERVVCLDARTGLTLWEHSYSCPYRIAYPSGPRATPVVAGGRVYTLGAMGDLLCLEVETGALRWSRNFLKAYHLADPPVWGYAAHPLLEGDRLICLVGGEGSAVVAFHKDTGEELWRALTAQEIGYAPPVIHRHNGRRQLLVWHPDALNGLDPQTGEVFWTQKYPVHGKPQRPEVTIAMPRCTGRRVFLTSYYQGSLLLEVPIGTGEPSLVWNRHSTSKSRMNDGLHAVMSTPVIMNGYIYGICGAGELRCLDLKTGDRQWETYAVTDGKPAFLATAFLVEQGGRHFIWNDHGELILGRLSPQGFEETSRAKLLETTEHCRGREVLWCHPAFANRCAYMHNGQELICVSLAAGEDR